MGINDLKIQAYSKPVSSLSNNPTQDGITAQELKERFDANANNEIKASINGIIEFLEALTGNEEIKGFKEVDGKFTYTLDGETYIETGYTKAEVDNLLTSKANEADVLTRTNAEIFTPTGDYQPATKKYVDDKIASTGAADMTQAVYDPTGKQTDIFAEIDKKLSLAGGTLTGALRTYAKGSMGGLVVYRDDTGHPGMEFRNSNDRLGYIGMNATSKHPFYLSTEGGVYNLYGEHNKDLIAQSFLSLAGGTLTGDIAINKTSAPKMTMTSGSGYTSIYKNANESVNYGTIVADSINDGTNLQFVINCAANINSLIRAVMYPAGGTAKAYSIFGEHNKPTGTYTGNGSATTRTIAIGGVGNLVMVYGANCVSLVTPYGAFTKEASGSGLYATKAEHMKFANGVLTIASQSNQYNGSGQTYNYQVL